MCARVRLFPHSAAHDSVYTRKPCTLCPCRQRSSSFATTSTACQRPPSCTSSTQPRSNTGSTRVLRVLFITRSPKVAVRQILNMDELLEQCQGWTYTDPASSIQFAAECGVWQPGSDLQSNIAAVRSADVVIGRHGAGMTNAFFMQEGGASECCFAIHLIAICNKWPNYLRTRRCSGGTVYPRLDPARAP